MTRDFCFWLKGYLDLNEGDPLSHEHVEKIRAKLAETLKACPPLPAYYSTPYYPYWGVTTNTNTRDYFNQQQLAALAPNSTLYGESTGTFGGGNGLGR